jgi:hypothetical protein
MRHAAFNLGLMVVVWLLAEQGVQAQMFNQRSGKSVLAQDPLGTSDGGAGGTTGGVGTLNFNERFIRGNRRAGSFVGGDSRDRKGFVGSQQGGQTGRVRPVVTTPRGSAPDANRTGSAAGRTRSGVYEPRLSIAFDVTRPAEEAIAQNLARLLAASPGFPSTSRIEVSVEDATATLRGEVASERDRTLAERLILFEPGIDSVRNELKVTSRPQAPGEYLPPLPTAKDRKKAATGSH